VLTVEPEALTLLTAQAFKDISHLLRPGHLQQLRNILDDGEASSNDKYVALELLKNANIAAGGVLPMCQDTGTAIVMGKKGQAVWTGGGDEAAIARGVYKTYTETNLRYSQVSPISMFKEVQTGTNLPAQIDIFATDGDAYKFLFVAKGGGSANKSYLYQQTPAVLNEAALLKFLDTQIRTLGTAACPPYHLAIVIGGTSAELNLKTVKLASTRYLDDLPSEGNDKGVAIRDRGMEQKVLELTRQMGIGAQFGGKYFCHDVRVIRIARPRRLGADRTGRKLLGRPPGRRQDHQGRHLPRGARDQPGALSARRRAAAALGRRRLGRPRQGHGAHALGADPASGEDAREPDRHLDRGARLGTCEAQGAARSRRGPARLFQAVPGLLRRPRQDADRHGLRLVRPDHRRPHGFLCRSVPGQRRLDGHAGQG
jgi:tartrate/fumarate subfamily iron-sulfur-dependent hydro-lyase alpha chain